MTQRRNIAVVSASRADYGHLYWPLRSLLAVPHCSVELLVTGAHLADPFGHTIDQIERDGLPVAERIACTPDDDGDAAMAAAIGVATAGFADVLARRRPDVLLVIADRYEMLAPVCAALALRIPVVHIEGGERSEGAIDQSIRNAITMMSHLHLTTTRAASQRIAAMGEEPWRVHRVGAASLDHLQRAILPDRAELEQGIGIDLELPTMVAAFHPVTIDRDTVREARAFFAAIARLQLQIVLCYPNADAGGRTIMEMAHVFCREHPVARLAVNLSPPVYWGLLRHAMVVCGNSSSGIMETPSLGVPSVDVGARQHGREIAANTVRAAADPEAIVAAVRHVTTDEFRAGLAGLVNPYGDGRAAERIARILASVPLDDRLLRKTTTIRTEPERL